MLKLLVLCGGVYLLSKSRSCPVSCKPRAARGPEPWLSRPSLQSISLYKKGELMHPFNTSSCTDERYALLTTHSEPTRLRRKRFFGSTALVLPSTVSPSTWVICRHLLHIVKHVSSPQQVSRRSLCRKAGIRPGQNGPTRVPKQKRQNTVSSIGKSVWLAD